MAKRSKLDDFETYPLENQNQLVKYNYLKEYPDRSAHGDRYYNFMIPCNDEEGLDLTECYVEVELKVLKGNGKNLDATDAKKIQPANDFFDSLFSRATLTVNGLPIGDDPLHQPQIAFLKNLLDFDERYLDTVIHNSNIFMKDYEYPVDSDGLVRHDYIENSKTLKLYGRLNHNGFTTKRLLRPNSNVEIQLERNPPEFCLIRSKNVKDKYKLEISGCKLNVRHVMYHQNALDQFRKEPIARFPFTKMATQQFDIPKDSQNHWSFNFALGDKTRCVYLAICEPESLAGRSWENNPMIFPAAHYGVNHVQFYSGYNKPILCQPYKPDFENGNIGRTYTELLKTVSTTNGHQTGKAIGLVPGDMKGLYGVFPLLTMLNYRDLTVEIGFKKPTPKRLTGLLFIVSDASFTVNENGVTHMQ